MGAWRWSRGRTLVLLGLVVPALVVLAATVTLSVLVTRSILAISDNVRVTQDLVDGNVRTLSQAQRELLRLHGALLDPRSTGDDVELRRALAAQRVHESTLDYQALTLGDPALLQRARDLAGRWDAVVDDQVAAIAAAGGTTTARQDAVDVDTVLEDVRRLELGYNQLVSDAEITRKVQASAANAATDDLVADTRLLLIVLGLTLVSFVVLVAGMVRLLTAARKRQVDAATRLRAAREQLLRQSVALRTTDNLVVITDPQGRLEWVNDAFLRRTGYVLDEVLGRVPGHFLQGPDTDPATTAFIRERVAAQRDFTCEILNYTKDGTPYWIALEVQPIRDDHDEVTGFVGVASDVTERRRTADELLRSKEAAEENARAKAQFLASMSHEIRTPLNAVLGLTELLLDTDLWPDQRDYVRTAHQSGRHLLSLVNDILDYSALESDQFEVETTATDVRSVLDDVVTMLEPAASRAGLRLTSVVDPLVPTTICTDPTRLRQVLINLVGNGVKFTEQGGVRITASYLPDVDDPKAGRLTLRVRDTGRGIPEDRLERIFDPFTQGDASTTRTHGGTGLGLAICGRIASRLDGELGVTSVEGEGSVFTFSIPVCAREDDLPSCAAPSPPPPPKIALSALRVLLAEDDQVNRMVALTMLRRLGVDADVAETGQEALDACAHVRYDVVLMDVHMPHVDGIAATRELRARGGHQPRIVALTANALEGDRERLLAVGMDDYVSKPFRLEDLRAALAASSVAPVVS